MSDVRGNIPMLTWQGHWPDCLSDSLWLDQLSALALPAFLKRCRWYGGKARHIDTLQISEQIIVPTSAVDAVIIIISVLFHDGKADKYCLPLTYSATEPEEKGLIAKLTTAAGEGFLIDALYYEPFRKALYAATVANTTLPANGGTLNFTRSKTLTHYPATATQTRVLQADQSNSALVIDDAFFLKIYRKVDYDLNPDLAITRFLTEETPFRHIPTYAGGIILHTTGKPIMVLGMMQKLVPNEGDAWPLMLAFMAESFEKMVEKGIVEQPAPTLSNALYHPYATLPELLQQSIRQRTADNLYLLGQRTAEMHQALAMGKDPAFSPEDFDQAYRQSFLQSLTQLVDKRLQLAKQTRETLPPALQDQVNYFVSHCDTIRHYFDQVSTLTTDAKRTRIHGDFHLGQVLFTGDNFIILDFEGEPESSLATRKIKHSPLKDVAGMVRSFHYALYATIVFNDRFQSIKEKVTDDWRLAMLKAITGSYLHGYFETLGNHPILPTSAADVKLLLDLHMLEKAIYELGYELNGRPDWATIPLKGIQYIVEGLSADEKTDTNA